MNTIHAGPDEREKILAWLESMKKQVESVLDQGGSVTLHSHASTEEFRWNGLSPSDFRYTGWTFGVSCGEYPRRKP